MSEPEQAMAEDDVEASDGSTDDDNAEAPARAARRPSTTRKRRTYDRDEVILRFTSCGRCGLFLAAYRLENDQQFTEAIKEIEADWLTLPWHPDLRELVHKSYGCPIDIESYYLEGSCPECLRPFSYAEPDPDQPAWFLIKL